MKIITITYNQEYDEYNVPNTVKRDDGYFTNDKEDAIGTAKLVYGEDIKIKFKTLKDE